MDEDVNVGPADEEPADEADELVRSFLDDWNPEEREETLARIGRAFLPLIFGSDLWIHRKVETIELLSHETVRRTTSVDFTAPHWLRQELKVGAAEDGYVVPLGLLEKRKLRAFDLSSGSTPEPMLLRRENAEISVQVLFQTAEAAFANAGLTVNADHGVWTDLRTVAERSSFEAASAVENILQNADDENDVAVALLGHPATMYLLQALGQNYVLVAHLKDIGSRRIVKFSQQQRLNLRGGEFSRIGRAGLWIGETTGLIPLALQIDTPGATSSESYHVELVVPEELRIQDAFALETRDEETIVLDTDPLADRGSLYFRNSLKSDMEDADYSVVFSVRPQRAGFPIAAAAISVVISLILSFGAWVQSPATGTDSAPISVLLAISAIFTGSIIRIGEHTLVRQIFWGPRLILSMVGALALAAIAGLAFGLSECAVQDVWRVTSIMSVILSVLLVLFAVRSLPFAVADWVINGREMHEIADSERNNEEGE